MCMIANKSTREILRDFLKIVPFMKENNPSLDLYKTRQLIINQFRNNMV